jgi:hypothetical protein
LSNVVLIAIINKGGVSGGKGFVGGGFSASGGIQFCESYANCNN